MSDAQKIEPLGCDEWDFLRDDDSAPRTDLADALAEALRETNQILSQCLFGTIRVNGQYLDREEVVSRNAAALAAYEARK